MITGFTITYGDFSIPVNLIRSSRKTMAVQVKADGTVNARIPHRIPDREIHKFISEHSDWIIRKYLEADKRRETGQIDGMPAYDDLSEKEKRQIREKIVGKVRFFSGIMGVSVGRIAVRNQKTRWGSCSAKGNLNFNYRLYYLPEELLDYVVIHELSHRRHMNHSPSFWNEVGKYCPDYRQRRRMLKGYSII